MTLDQFDKAISAFNAGIDGYFAKLYLTGGQNISGGVWARDNDMVRIDVRGNADEFAFIPITNIIAISAEA